jgi:NAD dependent epimerase/dehydratase family enzyme
VSGLRWTEEKKRAIVTAVVLGTRNVVTAISKLKDRPKIFVASSAIGFYASEATKK